MIEEKGLYPITILRTLHEEEQAILSGNGILTLQQLKAVPAGIEGIHESRLNELKTQAAEILQLGLRIDCLSRLQDGTETSGLW
jgi:hypothetical protein